MDRIVVSIHPFKLTQEVLVYKNLECIDREEVPMEELEQKIKEYSIKYDINHVDLSGTRAYTNKLKENLSDVTKYSTTLEIDVF